MNKAQVKMEIAKALAVTAEISDTQLSENAMSLMVDELANYPLPAVLDALRRCYRELKTRLTLAAILERIDTGLPSADEAFGMLCEAWKNESLTVVVPEIALLAGNGSFALWQNGDKTGARMAFKAAYERMAAKVNFADGIQWTVSHGTCRVQKVRAIQEAVQAGKIRAIHAAKLLPSEAIEARAALENKRLSLEEKQAIKDNVQAIRVQLAKLTANKMMENRRVS